MKVPRDGRWKKPPVVAIGPDVSMTAVRKATDWWAELGHRFGPITRSPAHDSIVILVDPARLDALRPPVVRGAEVYGEGHGLTRTHREGEFLVSAEILLQNGDDALVIAHELGHAIGFHHPRFCPTGHMMHPSAGSWDDHRGLEA